MFQKILLAYDGSSGAKRALDVALELAKVASAELWALAVEERLPQYAATVDEVKEEKGFCQNSINILAKRPHFCYAHPLKIKFDEESWLMDCPHCAAITTRKRTKKTKLGYTTFFCPHCLWTFNERTGTPFNYLEFPTDIVLLAVL
jgi:predicted RNA-binding Zn-ribbon protein involved in translation (DUF1610 family)